MAALQAVKHSESQTKLCKGGDAKERLKQQQLHVPCVNIHMTPSRLGVEALLAKCLLLSRQKERTKKKKRIRKRADCKAAAGAAALGHCASAGGFKQSCPPLIHPSTLTPHARIHVYLHGYWLTSHSVYGTCDQ